MLKFLCNLYYIMTTVFNIYNIEYHEHLYDDILNDSDDYYYQVSGFIQKQK